MNPPDDSATDPPDPTPATRAERTIDIGVGVPETTDPFTVGIGGSASADEIGYTYDQKSVIEPPDVEIVS